MSIHGSVLRGDDAIARIHTLAHTLSRRDVEVYARLESPDSYLAEVDKFFVKLDEGCELLVAHVELRSVSCGTVEVMCVPLDQDLKVTANQDVHIVSSPSLDYSLRLLLGDHSL